MDLTVAELMQMVNKEVYRHNCNGALEKYSLAMSYLPKSKQEQLDGKVNIFLRKLYLKIHVHSFLEKSEKHSAITCVPLILLSLSITPAMFILQYIKTLLAIIFLKIYRFIGRLLCRFK
jgi:hypothetical protein